MIAPAHVSDRNCKQGFPNKNGSVTVLVQGKNRAKADNAVL